MLDPEHVAGVPTATADQRTNMQYPGHPAAS